MFTPPLRELTPETSAGFGVITFAREILGLELYPWQEWLLIHALELLPNNRFRYRTVVVLVARQNGKSTVGQVLALWALYVLRVALVLGTAQSLDISSDLWRETVELAQDVPVLEAEISKVSRQMTRETLEINGRQRYKVAAATRKGGRGASGDLVLMDELREHTNWDSWSAITKTTMAREDALVWCMSNAGDLSSVVLRHLRKQGHARVGDPDGLNKGDKKLDLDYGASGDPELDELMDEMADTLGLFEWSAHPTAGKWDREGWQQANPSLGYGGLTERNIASAAATDPDLEFATEVLCQWSDGSTLGPFSEGKWNQGIVHEQPPPGTPFKLGIDMSIDRSMTYIVASYVRPDGLPQVSLEAARPGSEWVEEWLRERARPHDPIQVAFQARGAPISSIATAVDLIEGIDLIPWSGSEMSDATAMLFDAVEAAGVDDDGVRTGLCHLPAPALDLAAATAVPKILSGGGMLWDRKRSPQDAAPLVAATAAIWLLARIEEPAKVSAYDSGSSLMILD